jgi:hypothetical protein
VAPGWVIAPLVLGALAGLGLLTVLLASCRRPPPGRYAVVHRRGRRHLHRPGRTLLVPGLDRVTYLDGVARHAVVAPYLRSADGVTVGPTATAWLVVEAPARVVRRTGDPEREACEAVTAELVRFAGGRTVAELAALMQGPLPEVRTSADAVTAGFGIRVGGVRLDRLELPHPEELASRS